MAEVIQFHCPACGMTLRLPLAMAAQQGPCPNCDREIVAPDPYHGVGAFLAPIPPPPPVPEPFSLFVETPPLVPRHEEQETMRHPVYQQPAPSSPPSPAQSPSYPPEPFPAYQAEPFPLPEPLHPFSEPEPVVPEPFSSPPPEPTASAPATESPAGLEEAEKSHGRMVLLFACLVTGFITLVLGIILGALGTRVFAPIPPYKPAGFPPPAEPVQPAPPEIPAPVPVTPPAPPTTPEPEPIEPETPAPSAPEPAQPTPEASAPPPEPEPPPSVPAKISAGAEAALKAFLEAPDWAARSAHVLSPDKVKAAMEAYSREVPDGPTAYRAITVKQSEVEESTRSTIFIFMVITERHPEGIPVAVKETAGGWLVDWLAFVEFRDDLFQKFTDGPVDKTGFFHLIVTRPPEKRAEETENEHFSSFVLQSPVSGKGQLAFIRKGTSAYETVHAATEGGAAFTPLLEVRKSKTAEGQSYFEVMAVKANDWFPREN